MVWAAAAPSQAPAAEDASPQAPPEAFYVMSPSVERMAVPVTEVSLRITGREEVEGRSLVWWELAARPPKGPCFGIRLLSERCAMTGPEGIGRVHRYLYADSEGKVLDYREAADDRALLPALQFAESFLPRPAIDAVFDGGFASAGAYLGHVLVRTLPVGEPPRVSFADARVLRLRSDLIVGAQVDYDVQKPDPDAQNHIERPYTAEEYRDLIARGVNFFNGEPKENRWLWYEPVFCRATPVFPDTFYRSNWIPGPMFIDEPSVRLGWSGDIPANPTGPEQVAEALRQRVTSHYTISRRLLGKGHDSPYGTLDLLLPNPISWDTDYWSAWYQFAAGAPALVHEGRYVQRGYGWEPQELYGDEGLEGLTFRDQVNCLNAFLRGAARAFDGDWGVSVYPEGDPALRLPALTQAYDMGARYIWFWIYPPMNLAVHRELAEGLLRHVCRHPRRSCRQASRAARVGIVLPPGYVFSWQGTWGMQREQRSRGGAGYGDISAAAMWEAILCSRRGIPFDFLVDSPQARAAGYERLVFVREDGRLEFSPPTGESRVPGRLELKWDGGPVPDVAARAGGAADHVAVRAGAIRIDGRLDDWPHAAWIAMDAATHGFPDVLEEIETVIVNDLSNPKWRLHFTSYMGMDFAQIDEDLERKYVLEEFGGRGVVVTAVAPESPAARAGILEGDVLVWMLSHQLNWQFQVYERMAPYKDAHDGAPVRVRLRRSGRYHFGAPGDLAARVALAADDARLYLAAEVTDDVHAQPHHGADLWKGDSVQIGLDPTLERRDYGYGEEDHELGLALDNGRPVLWRFAGRRGQPLGPVDGAEVRIIREDGRTTYEASVPLEELRPMSPDLWPRIGFDVVVNDCDGGVRRKGRLELRPKAMTLGKKTRQFARLEFPPSDDRDKLSAALMWRRRATVEGGFFRLVTACRSPQTTAGTVTAVLRSLDDPAAPPRTATVAVPVGPQAAEASLAVRTDSPPGRYELAVEVRDPRGQAVTGDRLPVYVYPDATAASGE